jgi:hypothetical protein
MARLSTERLSTARAGTARVGRALRARALPQARAVEELTARVPSLEEEVRECRRQQLRLAELTDVVQELLLPVSQRDQEKVEELLERYSAQLG